MNARRKMRGVVDPITLGFLVALVGTLVAFRLDGVEPASQGATAETVTLATTSQSGTEAH